MKAHKGVTTAAHGSAKNAAAIAQRISQGGATSVEAIVAGVLEEMNRFEPIHLWEQQEAAVSYWVLMLTGVNQPTEMEIATQILVWQTFLAKDSAKLACVQSSDRRAFRVCSAAFGVSACPTLILSDSPDMKNSLAIEAGLLSALMAQPGDLQKFLTRIQSLLENGSTLTDIRNQLDAEAFYRGIKVVYKEVKNFVSIKIAG